MREHVARLNLPDRARLTPVEQTHLTLQFIGDTPAADLDATIESVQRAASGLRAFALNLQRLIALPERGAKRLLAAETDAPAALMELQKRLAVRLATNVRDKPGRDFRPHITLCRFASPIHGYGVDASPAAMHGSFHVREISLMRSTLSNRGATHHVVERVALG